MGRCHIFERDVHEIGGWYILKSAMVSIWQDALVAQKKRETEILQESAVRMYAKKRTSAWKREASKCRGGDMKPSPLHAGVVHPVSYDLHGKSLKRGYSCH